MERIENWCFEQHEHFGAYSGLLAVDGTAYRGVSGDCCITKLLRQGEMAIEEPCCKYMTLIFGSEVGGNRALLFCGVSFAGLFLVSLSATQPRASNSSGWFSSIICFGLPYPKVQETRAQALMLSNKEVFSL